MEIGQSEEEFKRLFPSGVPGSLSQELSSTGTRRLLIRPTGVSLVHHLEHWRQTNGRTIAAGGSPVMDINPSDSYEPVKLDLPSKRTLGAAVANSPSLKKRHAESHASALANASRNPHEIPVLPVRILTGPSGIGKSGILAYVIAYARLNNWLCIAIPDTFDMMQRGLVLVKSKSRPGMVDQHDMALKILQDTLVANKEILNRIPQRNAYARYKYLPKDEDARISVERQTQRKIEETEMTRLRGEAESAGKTWDPSSYKSKVTDEVDTSVDRSKYTLADMLTWGIAHPAGATDALLDFLSEIRLVTEFPVLVAIDGLNLLYDSPSIYPQDGENVPPEKLSVPSSFHVMNDKGFNEAMTLKRGVYLTAITRKHSAKMRLFEVTDAREKFRVRVPELTRQEIYSTLKHYQQTGRFFMVEDEKSVDAFAVEYYKLMSGGSPAEVFNAAMFTPQ
jgi:Mitochondrial ribosomal death-associated protein 3